MLNYCPNWSTSRMQSPFQSVSFSAYSDLSKFAVIAWFSAPVRTKQRFRLLSIKSFPKVGDCNTYIPYCLITMRIVLPSWQFKPIVIPQDINLLKIEVLWTSNVKILYQDGGCTLQVSKNWLPNLPLLPQDVMSSKPYIFLLSFVWVVWTTSLRNSNSTLSFVQCFLSSTSRDIEHLLTPASWCLSVLPILKYRSGPTIIKTWIGASNHLTKQSKETKAGRVVS